MPECSFCKNNYDIPRGTTKVLPNGELLYFCSSKCLKNNKLGRIGKKTTWVRKSKKAKDKTDDKDKVSKDKPLEKVSKSEEPTKEKVSKDAAR